MSSSIVKTFLFDVDTTMPLRDHLLNLFRNARMYNWDSGTVIAIMVGLEEVYTPLRDGESLNL